MGNKKNNPSQYLFFFFFFGFFLGMGWGSELRAFSIFQYWKFGDFFPPKLAKLFKFAMERLVWSKGWSLKHAIFMWIFILLIVLVFWNKCSSKVCTIHGNGVGREILILQKNLIIITMFGWWKILHYILILTHSFHYSDLFLVMLWLNPMQQYPTMSPKFCPCH